MAEKAEPERRRAKTYVPDVEIGDTLDTIEGIDVEVASIGFESRSGKGEDYTLAIITLTDGRMFHSGSKPLTEFLGKVPTSELPLWMTFTLTRSASNPTRSYWTVS